MQADNYVQYLTKNTTIKWMVITPEIAEKMLTRNTNNYRKLNHNQVKLYAEDMKAGAWAANGEPIVFDDEAVLINGQHRLNAVVLSETPIIALVIYGIPSKVKEYDLGTKRQITTIMKAEGVEGINVTIIGAVNSIMHNFRAGGNCNKTGYKTRKYATDNIEMLKKAFDICNRGSDRKICKKSDVVAAVYSIMLYTGQSEDIEKLIAIATSGIPMEGVNSNPGLILRNMLLEVKGVSTDAEVKRLLYDATWQAYKDQTKGIKRRCKYKYTGASEGLLEWVKTSTNCE